MGTVIDSLMFCPFFVEWEEGKELRVPISRAGKRVRVLCLGGSWGVVFFQSGYRS